MADALSVITVYNIVLLKQAPYSSPPQGQLCTNRAAWPNS